MYRSSPIISVKKDKDFVFCEHYTTSDVIDNAMEVNLLFKYAISLVTKIKMFSLIRLSGCLCHEKDTILSPEISHACRGEQEHVEFQKD